MSTARNTHSSQQAQTTDKPELTPAFDLIKPSAEATKRNFNSFLAIILAPGIYFSFLSYLQNVIHAHFSGTTWTALYAPGFLYLLLTIAASAYLELMSAQGKTLTLAETIRGSFKYFWRLIGLYIITGVLVGVGFVLFIIPGVIMVRRYFLASYFLIDKNLGIFEAMRRSAAATKGRMGAVWGIVGVQLLLGVPGFIPVIGGFISNVFEMFYASAPALRYEELKRLPAAKK
jgi:hypothetical protein